MELPSKPEKHFGKEADERKAREYGIPNPDRYYAKSIHVVKKMRGVYIYDDKGNENGGPFQYVDIENAKDGLVKIYDNKGNKGVYNYYDKKVLIPQLDVYDIVIFEKGIFGVAEKKENGKAYNELKIYNAAGKARADLKAKYDRQDEGVLKEINLMESRQEAIESLNENADSLLGEYLRGAAKTVYDKKNGDGKN